MSFKKYCILLALLTFLAFIPSLKNGFVWDDKEIIFEQIKHIEGLNIYKPNFIYYRPITHISFLFDYFLWKYNPFGYHLTNVILHILNVLLFFILLNKIFARLKLDLTFILLLSLVFAFHPVHVESVSWIAGRTDILVTFFSLLTLIAAQLYLERQDKRILILIFVFFLLALASKEMAIVLLPILFIENFITKKDKVFNVCLLLIIGVITLYILTKISGLCTYGWHFNLISLIKATGFYLKSLIFPYPFYSYMPYLPIWGIYITLSFFILAGLIFFSIFKKNKLYAQVGLAYLNMFLISLLPILALIVFRIGATPVAWRYLYLPSLFFILGIGIWTINIKNVKLATLGLSLCFFLITITHQSIWRDDFHFWKRAVTLADKDYAIPHHQYALALWEKGDLKTAEKHFLLALNAKDIQAYPWEKAVVYNNLGRLYATQKKWRNAEKCFKNALFYNPNYKPALCSLGKLYLFFYQKNNDKTFLKEAKKFLKKCH